VSNPVIPSLAVALVAGVHQCQNCKAIGDDAIGDGDVGDQFLKCQRCGCAAIIFHNPTVQHELAGPPRARKEPRRRQHRLL